MGKSSKLTALIDGDILIYKSAAAVERPVDWGEGLWTLHSYLPEAIDHFEDTVLSVVQALSQEYDASVSTVFALSDRESNFRKELWPEYKANRANKRSPLCRGPLYDYVLKTHPTRFYPGLEADDVLGILMTSRGNKQDRVTGKKVLVSIDKDLNTVPGLHYNYGKDVHYNVDAAQADYYFMCQTLTGDPVDGYAGVKGVGAKTAEKLLADKTGIEEWWPAVVAAYTKAGLTEHYALTMARMARICRAQDYDFTKGEVILWTPPTR